MSRHLQKINRKPYMVVHVGQTGQSERTDPDYCDKRIARMAQDYLSLESREWCEVFMAGLDGPDRRALEKFFQDQQSNPQPGEPGEHSDSVLSRGQKGNQTLKDRRFVPAERNPGEDARASKGQSAALRSSRQC